MMKGLDEKTLTHYENEAENLSVKYNSAESPLATFWGSYFEKGISVLDLGCGSCRDLNWLHENGCRVSGLEPSEALIEIALKNYPYLEKSVYHGNLPDNIPSYIISNKYDCILAMAVFQHLENEVVKQSISLISSLLENKSSFVLSIPLIYEDAAENGRDSNDRLFLLRSTEFYSTICKDNNLFLKKDFKNGDSLARKNICWQSLIFEKRD